MTTVTGMVLVNSEKIERRIARVVALEEGGFSGQISLRGKTVKVRKEKRKKTWELV